MNRNIVCNFIAAINSHDTDTIGIMMTENHVFIDSHSNTLKGKNPMKSAWEKYFELFPDYKIEVSEIIDGDNCLAIFGFAEGTYMNLHNPGGSNHFRIPAAWKAVVEIGKIRSWQVYADTKIPFDIIDKNK